MVKLSSTDRATLRQVLADVERAETLIPLPIPIPQNQGQEGMIRARLDAASSVLARFIVRH